MLHDKDDADRKSAKSEYVRYIDKVMSASHGDFSLNVNAGCEKCQTPGDINDIYKAVDTALGATGSFGCSSGNIVSVTVCLDKQMNVMTCPSSQYNSSCKGKVYLKASPQ